MPSHDDRESDDSIRGAFKSLLKVQNIAGGLGGSRPPPPPHDDRNSDDSIRSKQSKI